MKKFLLSMGAVLLTASMSWADMTTLVFDGENDMAGLTRQTVANPTDVVKEVTYSQDGVDFKLGIASGTGAGFALVNAGGSNAGLYISTMIDSELTLTVPNGHITAAKVYMSGFALTTLGITFNGKEVESTSEGSLYSWTWSDKEGGETLTMTWPLGYRARYIHSIELSYTQDLGGKEACGLSFSTNTAEGFVGESFTAPRLSNPNRLAVTYSSSDESVATVNANGAVTLIGKGTTNIIAATEGNAQYAPGNARYTLTVTPVANSVAEMFEFAPNQNDKVKVNFPMTTYFSFGASVYAEDRNSTPIFITDGRVDDQKPTVFAIGDIIPANWIATNFGREGYKGRPADPTEKVDVVYRKVSNVTRADANEVAILKNVTFNEPTPSETSIVEATIPNGNKYNVQNPFGAPVMPAGTYDVTLVVKCEVIGSTEYFYLAPIAYAEPSGEDEDLPVFPERFDVTISTSGVTVDQMEEQGVYTIKLGGTATTETFIVTLAVPEGWDGFIGLTNGEGMNVEVSPVLKVVAAEEEEEWTSVSIMEEQGLTKGNSLGFTADGEEYFGQMYLYTGDKVYLKQIMLEVEVAQGDPNGVETVEVNEGSVRYFNLQGVEVTNPQNGIYVKVLNGKAAKVSLK